MKITAEFNSLEEMYGFCEEVTGGKEPKPTKAKKAKATEPAPEPAPAVKPESIPAPEPAAVPEPVPEPKTDVKKITLQDVTAKAIPLIDAGRQGDLQALLTKYGVPALPSLMTLPDPEKKLAEFLKDLEALG